MLKLSLFLELLCVNSADLSSPLTPLRLVGYDLDHAFTDGDGGRNLVTPNVCTQVVSTAEDILGQVYGFPFRCDCAGSYVLTCDSKGIACCGGVCGTVQQIFFFTSALALSVRRPVPHSSPVQESSMGFLVVPKASIPQGVFSSVKDPSAARVAVIPGAPIGTEFMTLDCGNIPGGDLLSAACEDLDTLEEIEAFALQCGEDVLFNEIDDFSAARAAFHQKVLFAVAAFSSL